MTPSVAVSTITNTGATSSTPGSFSIRVTCDSGITALEKEKNIDEFGGCTMISAPTPSARVRQSLKIPEVSPTIRRIKNTCRPMAAALKAERKGCTPRFRHSKCRKMNLGGRICWALRSAVKCGYHGCVCAWASRKFVIPWKTYSNTVLAARSKTVSMARCAVQVQKNQRWEILFQRFFGREANSFQQMC